MRNQMIFLLSLLGACAEPQGHFAAAPVQRVTVDGAVFDIRLRGNLAEATRVNPQYAPRLGPLRVQAAEAMAAVSGCRVTGVLGDQALMTGVLDCSERSKEERAEEGPAPLCLRHIHPGIFLER
ncbi:hypothetical protein [Phaeobacter sp. 11ANDIMAR09]|uniref:hypothetical protein n=1 Tax=Phaeobacter sp. 11ANDIMAR09 TaxID=1225647 RepID=UPI000B0A9184|nr:hypothetical protein [Phaeobacter sp. 11ANDIMAR09]